MGRFRREPVNEPVNVGELSVPQIRDVLATYYVEARRMPGEDRRVWLAREIRRLELVASMREPTHR